MHATCTYNMYSRTSFIQTRWDQPNVIKVGFGKPEHLDKISEVLLLHSNCQSLGYVLIPLWETGAACMYKHVYLCTYVPTEYLNSIPMPCYVVHPSCPVLLNCYRYTVTHAPKGSRSHARLHTAALSLLVCTCGQLDLLCS